jgi:competence protein ComEC
LKKDNIYFITHPYEVSIESHDNGNEILSILYKFRATFLDHISKYIQQPESSLGAGILLGVKENLGQKNEDDFIKTGTIHIVALSGYNVTIVAEWLIRILSIFLSIAVSLWVGIVGIVVFVVMTGAGSTVVRAGVMAILVLVGRILGREYDIGRGLVIAGTLMILINPWILVYDVSFQLSFMATIGLVYLAPIIKRKIKFIPEKFSLRSLVGDTLGTYIFVLPFIVYVMGNLSLVAIFANVMIVPFVPLTMLLVFITATLSFIFSYLGIFFGFISWALLHYELYMVHFFADLPFSSLNISHISILIIIAIYILLGFYMYKENRGSQPEKI